MSLGLKFDVAGTQGAARRGLSLRRADRFARRLSCRSDGATVKAMHPQAVKALGADIVLANTIIDAASWCRAHRRTRGLHEFMQWPGPILTDSVASVMSLSKLRKLDENGVTFQSHIDGRAMC